VLKISVDRERINHEAVALARWETRHVPVVLAWDQDVGALLLEAVEPGTPLDLSGRYSSTSSQAARRPALAEVVPIALYDQGRRAALRLGAEATGGAVLHGDLTPANLLDGGNRRGLVAIDPAPCLGTPALTALISCCGRRTTSRACTRVQSGSPRQ
jgi:streptomycin 6-kinase